MFLLIPCWLYVTDDTVNRINAFPPSCSGPEFHTEFNGFTSLLCPGIPYSDPWLHSTQYLLPLLVPTCPKLSPHLFLLWDGMWPSCYCWFLLLSSFLSLFLTLKRDVSRAFAGHLELWLCISGTSIGITEGYFPPIAKRIFLWIPSPAVQNQWYEDLWTENAVFHVNCSCRNKQLSIPDRAHTTDQRNDSTQA